MHIGEKCNFLPKVEPSPRKIFFTLSQGPKLKSVFFAYEIYTCYWVFSIKNLIRIPKPGTRVKKNGKNDGDPENFKKRPFDPETTLNFLKINDKNYLMADSFF